jgi:hypothetical protein
MVDDVTLSKITFLREEGKRFARKMEEWIAEAGLSRRDEYASQGTSAGRN